MDIPENTVIPSIRRLKEVDAAAACPSPAVLLTAAHIGNLSDLSKALHGAGKKVLVHADLVGGFRPDRDGIKLLRNMFKVDGVFSQNAQVVSTAQKSGMWAIQRVFLMDSRSLERSLEILEESRPNGIEILPGALAIRYAELFTRVARGATLIAGGMVTTRREADALFACGYTAITSSTRELWGRA